MYGTTGICSALWLLSTSAKDSIGVPKLNVLGLTINSEFLFGVYLRASIRELSVELSTASEAIINGFSVSGFFYPGL